MNLWDKFIESGKIADYLEYVKNTGKDAENDNP